MSVPSSPSSSSVCDVVVRSLSVRPVVRLVVVGPLYIRPVVRPVGAVIAVVAVVVLCPFVRPVICPVVVVRPLYACPSRLLSYYYLHDVM